MTTTCILRSGILATLSACGPYSTTQISTCDYGILERSSGCAILIHYGPEENSEPTTFRGADTDVSMFDVIQFQGECYIQFIGNPQKLLSDVYQARDDIKATFHKDVKLQSSACFAYLSGFRYNIDEAYEMGGKEWALLRFQLTVHDLP